MVTWSWSLLAGAIGVAAGLQTIYEKHTKEFIDGSLTFPGILYLLSRGALPAGAFALLFPTRYLGSIEWVAALGCGVSSEVLLRSQFFIKRTGGEDVLAGPLDLLKSWQGITLQYVGPHVARKKKNFIDRYLPTQPFLDLCQIAKRNVGYLEEESRVQPLREQVDGLVAKHQAEANPNDAEYRLELGFLLYRHLARAEFKVVVKN